MSDKPQAIAPKAQPSAAAGAVTSGAATYEQVGRSQPIIPIVD